MRNSVYLLALLLLTALSTNVLADDGESYTSYDAIVNELTASADEPTRVTTSDWDEVAIHAGVGFATSLVSIHLPSGDSGSGLFKGIQVSGGFNLFSKEARLEGAYTSFQRESLGGGMGGDLKELEARLVWAPRTSTGIIARAGFGMSMRYMEIGVHNSRTDSNTSAQTPSSILLFGLEKKLGKSVAVGPDLSYRSAIGGAVFDNSSWNASLRLNATF